MNYEHGLIVMKNIFQMISDTVSRQKHGFYKVALVLSLSVFNIAHATNSVDNHLDFKVYLDGDEIGFHNFSLVQKDNHQEIYSSARFNVKSCFSMPTAMNTMMSNTGVASA